MIYKFNSGTKVKVLVGKFKDNIGTVVDILQEGDPDKCIENIYLVRINGYPYDLDFPESTLAKF